MTQSAINRNHLITAFNPTNPDGIRKIGIETEKFILHAQSGTSWPVKGEYGLQWVMHELARQFNYSIVAEGDSIVALQRDGHQISLEPGGQIEFSSYQSQYVSDLHTAELSHLKELKHILSGKDAAISYIACHPISELEDVEWVRKKRYDLMRNHFKQTGDLAEWMMKMTSSVQVSLDYRNEVEARMMSNVIAKLTPILNAISAFSPLSEGRATGFLSYRSFIWSRTDPKRCGLPECLFAESDFFNRYYEYALQVPLLFQVNKGDMSDARQMNFSEWVASSKNLTADQIMEAWKMHLTCLFPDVRMKHYLEVRCFDAIPGRHAFALAVLLKNILYDDASFAEIQSGLALIERTETIAAMESAARFGLKGYYANKSIYEWAVWLFGVAVKGGEGMSRLDGKHEQDEVFLKALHKDVIESNETYAEKFMETLKTKSIAQAVTMEPFGFKF